MNSGLDALTEVQKAVSKLERRLNKMQKKIAKLESKLGNYALTYEGFQQRSLNKERESQDTITGLKDSIAALDDESEKIQRMS